MENTHAMNDQASEGFKRGLRGHLDGVPVYPSKYSNGPNQDGWSVTSDDEPDAYLAGILLGQKRAAEIMAVKESHPQGRFIYLQNWPLNVRETGDGGFRVTERGNLVDVSGGELRCYFEPVS